MLRKVCPKIKDFIQEENIFRLLFLFQGGGYDMLSLFPEKLQVIVCEYMPHTGVANENQQTSSYFDATKTSSEKYKTQTNTAKKKKLQLKRMWVNRQCFLTHFPTFPVIF